MSAMKNKKNFPGLDGFVWWTGIVEGRQDPLKLGRVQVRCFGWHTESKQNIPSDELLWAHPAFAANVYQTTHVPKEGENVFGFFMDGEDGQFPFYFGVIPAIPGKIYPKTEGFSDPGDDADVKRRPIPVHLGKPTRYPNIQDLDEPTTSRLARNENIDKTPLGGAYAANFKKLAADVVASEATGGTDTTQILASGLLEILASEKPFYAAKYPYNCSVMTESGHYIDYDDSPGAERITLLHRTGSFLELKPNGDVRLYAANDLYLTGEKNVYITAKTKMIHNKAVTEILEEIQMLKHTTKGIHIDNIGYHY